jgi:hypothetical protein
MQVLSLLLVLRLCLIRTFSLTLLPQLACTQDHVELDNAERDACRRGRAWVLRHSWSTPGKHSNIQKHHCCWNRLGLIIGLHQLSATKVSLKAGQCTLPVDIVEFKRQGEDRKLGGSCVL